MPIRSSAALLALLCLAGCGGGDKSGRNVALRDVEVIDGTANDAMVDLDNATVDGTAIDSNMAAPGVDRSGTGPAGNAAATPAEPDNGGNASR